MPTDAHANMKLQSGPSITFGEAHEAILDCSPILGHSSNSDLNVNRCFNQQVDGLQDALIGALASYEIIRLLLWTAEADLDPI